MKVEFVKNLVARIRASLRKPLSFTLNKTRYSQLCIEALEQRLVLAVVAPGGWWDDGQDTPLGQRVGVTVSLTNSGSGWLTVTGGGGAVSVSPGAPPISQNGMGEGIALGPVVPLASSYMFSVYGLAGEGSGDVTWSGAADTLVVYATGDVADISIGGDLYVQAGWTIGNLDCRNIRAITGLSIGNISAADDIGTVTSVKSIGTVSANDSIYWVSAGTSIGMVTALGNITAIQAGTSTSGISVGGWLGTVSAGLDIGGEVSAGLWIGGAYFPDAVPGEYLPWYYSSYGSGLVAGRDILGSVTAGKGIVAVSAGRDILGSVSVAGGDIGLVRAGGGGLWMPTSHSEGIGYPSMGTWTSYAPGCVRGTVTASRDIYAVTATGDVVGSVTAQGGFVGGVNASGAITGSVTADTDIGRIEVRQEEVNWRPNPGYLYYGVYGYGYGNNLPQGAGVSAGGVVSGNVTAITGEITFVTAGATLSGKVKAGHGIGGVSSRDGITSGIEAGWDIGFVSSRGNIAGDIKAGQDIGMISAGAFWITGLGADGLYGEVATLSGAVTAGRDIGSVTASADITGEIRAKRDIGTLNVGTGGVGGRLAGSVSAGRNIGSITVVGSGGSIVVVALPAIEALPFYLATLDPMTGESALRQPDRPAFAMGGEISGDVSVGGSMGAVTAFGVISGDLAAGTSMGRVWASGDVSGAISSGDAVVLESWGTINGDLDGMTGVNVGCYGSFTGSVISASGEVRVGSWGEVSGSVLGDQAVLVTALRGVLAGSIESQSNEATVTAIQGDLTTNITAAFSVNALAKTGGLSGMLTSRSANVSATGFKDVTATINVNFGYAMILSYGNYTGDVSAAYDAIIAVRGNLTGNIDAGRAATVYAAGQVNGRIMSTLNDIDIAAGGFSGTAIAGTNLSIRSWGDVSGTLSARNDLDAFVIGDLKAFVRSDMGKTVSLEVTGDITAPVVADMADITAHIYGSLKGDMSTQIGSITATIDGDLLGSITGFKSVSVTTWGNSIGAICTQAGGGFVELTAEGSVTGAVSSAGDATVLAHGNITGAISAGEGGITANEDGTHRTYDARVESFGQVATNVTATGKVTVGTYKSASGVFTARGGELAVTAMGEATGTFIGETGVSLTAKSIHGTALAQAGSVTINAFENVIVNATSKSGFVTIAAGTTALARITATTGATLSANETIQGGTIVEAGTGDAMVTAGGSINATVSGANVTIAAGTTINLAAVLATGDLTITALGDVTVASGHAEQDFTLLAMVTTGVFSSGRNFSGQTQSFNGTILANGETSLLSIGTVTGTVSAGGIVLVTTLDGGAVIGTVTGGDVTVDADGSVLGAINGTSQVFVRSGESVEATVTTSAGSATVIAMGGDICKAVTAGLGATVSASGNVIGRVEARGGDADVWALGDIAGIVLASDSANVTAWGSVLEAVTAVTGTATVFGNTGVMKAITAGLDASVSTGISGAIAGAVTAGRDASLWAKNGIHGSVLAGNNVSATSMGDISAPVLALQNASVWAMGDILESVTANAGSVQVTAWQSVFGAITAGTVANVWAYGSINETVSAGTNVLLDTWGKVIGDVVAGENALVWAAGDITGEIVAEGSVDVTTWGNLSGGITAALTATLWVRGEVSQEVRAGTDLTATVIGTIAFTRLDAGRNATITALGNICADISAGGIANLSVVGDLAGSVTAADSMVVYATGDVAGWLTAGNSGSVTALGAFTGTLTAGMDATLWAFDWVKGHVIATQGAATLLSWGDWAGSVTAGTDATVFAYGTAHGKVTAGTSGSITVQKGGIIEAMAGLDLTIVSGADALVTASAAQDLFVTVDGNAYGLHGSAGRDAMVMALGNFYGTVAAGQDATVAFTGMGHWPTVVTADRDAMLWSGSGLVGIPNQTSRSFLVTAGHDAFLQSWGDATEVLVSAGNDAMNWARGDILGNATAILGNARVVGYGQSVNARVTAGLDVAVAALGNLTVNATAGRDLDLFAVGSLVETHAAAGITTLRSYTGFEPVSEWVAANRAVVDASFASSAASLAVTDQALEDWKTGLATERLTVKDAVFASLADGAQQIANMTTATQGLLEARAQALADKQEVLAGLALATADIAQAFANAAAEINAARDAVEVERALGRAAIAGARAAAVTELSNNLKEASDNLISLMTDFNTTSSLDVAEAGLAMAAHLLDAQGRLNLLAVTNAESYWDTTVQQKVNETLDYVEMTLAVVGLVPGLGSITSLAGTLISLWRGNYAAAAFDALGMIPVIGSVVNEIKLTKIGAGAAARISKATSAVHWAAEVTAKGGKAWIAAQALRTGSPLWQSVYRAYDFVVCKALRLACFTAGTPIETEFGSRAIETIKPGDRVWCRSETDQFGPLELKSVEQVLERWARVLTLALPNGVEIGTTEEHPFWVMGKGWVNAVNLQVGDRLISEEGLEVRVEGITDTGSFEKVYNLRVAENHTYYVGSAAWGFDVWVHNAKCSKVLHLENSPVQLLILNKFTRGTSEYRQLQRYVKEWNNQIKIAGGSMTRRILTPEEIKASAAWLKKMRKEAPHRFVNMVVGHLPDAAAGGKAVSDRAMALIPSVNSYLGGLLNGIKVGTTYNFVGFFK